MLFTSMVGSFLVSMNDFITNYIISPSLILYVLWGVYVADWLLAVYVAIVAKDFRSEKAKKLIPKIVSTTVLLAMLFWVGKAFQNEQQLIFYSIRQLTLALSFYMMMVEIVSFAATGERNKIFRTGITSIIAKYADTHKKALINKIEKNDKK